MKQAAVKSASPTGKAAKRSSDEVDGVAAQPQHARRKRNAEVVAELEEKLALYRDWILPGGGAVRTARPKRSYIEEHGFDKREVLADSVYWDDQL